jgi:hypothetical protein
VTSGKHIVVCVLDGFSTEQVVPLEHCRIATRPLGEVGATFVSTTSSACLAHRTLLTHPGLNGGVLDESLSVHRDAGVTGTPYVRVRGRAQFAVRRTWRIPDFNQPDHRSDNDRNSDDGEGDQMRGNDPLFS